MLSNMLDILVFPTYFKTNKDNPFNSISGMVSMSASFEDVDNVDSSCSCEIIKAEANLNWIDKK